MRRRPKEKPSALVKAVDFLAQQEHSEAKLREKLARREYEAEEINAAVDRLKEKHYLNDEDACRRQFGYFFEDGRMSVRQICQKLIQRGFASDLVYSCIPEEKEEHEEEAAFRAACGRFRSAVKRDKIKQFLYRRGFSFSVCDAAVRRFVEEYPERIEEEQDFDE